MYKEMQRNAECSLFLITLLSLFFLLWALFDPSRDNPEELIGREEKKKEKEEGLVYVCAYLGLLAETEAKNFGR